MFSYAFFSYSDFFFIIHSARSTAAFHHRFNLFKFIFRSFDVRDMAGSGSIGRPLCVFLSIIENFEE